MTAGVSAQIEFEGDENGLRVNGKTIDPSNLPEGLGDILADQGIFSALGRSFSNVGHGQWGAVRGFGGQDCRV